METHYDYLDTPAWHYDDSELVAADKRTWTQWRGYSKVRVRQGLETGTQSATELLYMRGMDGDRATAGGGEKDVQVVDSQGVAIEDHEAHAGFLRESTVYNGLGGAWIGGTIADPWRHGPTASTGPLQAYLTNTAGSRTRTALQSGGTRWVKSATTFDEDYGLPMQVDDLGDESTSSDDKCTRYGYARNETAGIVATVASVQTVGVKCQTAPRIPEDVLSQARTFYDDPETFGATPTRGLTVKTQVVASWNGSTPNWVTTSRATYDAHGRPLEVFDELDRKTTHGYTPAGGGPVLGNSLTNALGHTTTSVIEPAWGRAVSTVDANGLATALTYDGLGRVTNAWLPGRAKATQTPNMQFEYLVRNNAPSAVTVKTLLPVNEAYKTTITLLDGSLRDRQTQAQAPGGGRLVSDTIYDSRGLVDWQSHEFYDSSNSPPSTTLIGAGQPQIPGLVQYVYDGAGRVTTEIFKALGVEKWRSSVAYGGDRVHVTPPTGGTATTSISDARGGSVALRQYHGLTPSGTYDETTYSYTKRGELASVTDPAGNTWSWEYDLRGRRVSATDPDAGTSSQTYDVAGQVATSTDGRGVTVGYTYDALGRRTSTRDGSPTGALRAEWAYDTLPRGLGGLTRSIRHDNGNQYTTEVLGYDEAGRPTGARVIIPDGETGLTGTYDTSVTYLPDGSLYTTTLPAIGGLNAEKLGFAYNDVGAPTEIVSAESIYVYSVAYDKLGMLTQRVLGNYGKRTAVTNTFDEPTGRLTNTSVVPENRPEVADLAYSYDAAGNLLRVADSPGSSLPNDTQCFRYDNLRRLTTAWTPSSKAATNCNANPSFLGGAAPYWHDYTYDATGNRVTQVEHATGGNSTTTYTHPAAGSARPHTVTSATRTGPSGSTLSTYTYDAAGNTVQRVVGGNTQDLRWDAEGQIDEIEDPNGTTSFVYDADGNRLIRRDGTGKTLYLGGQELRYDTVSGLRSGTRYYAHLGTAIAVRTEAGLTWTATDHHNTGEVMIRESDMAVQRRRTQPFGDTRGTPPSWWAGDKGFVGGTQDPTGLTHLGARLYDSQLGRFVSVDPIVDVTDPQQMHAYAYANNNPTSFSDPDGLKLCGDDACLLYVAPMPGGGTKIVDNRPKPKPKPCNGAPVCHPETGSGGGTPTPASTVNPELEAAKAAAEAAKQQLINAAKTLLNIAMDELGITAALDCFTGGDMGACAETALNVASSFVGGLAGKLLGKYGAPWKWKKGAALVKRIWNTLDNLITGVKNWWKNSKLAQKLAASSGCSVAKNSFVPGTAVLMADGSTKPIEDVDVGDIVQATDPETGETTPKVVVGTIIGSGSKNLVHVTVDADGDDGDATGTIIATHNHPFWVPELNEWLPATDLRAGQRLQTSAGLWAQITAVARWTQSARVYNLTVADIHTYYVLAGTTAVLVHNTGDIPAPSMGPQQNPSRGSTARRGHVDWEEELLQVARGNPQDGEELWKIPQTDPRWPREKGWTKMEQIVDGEDVHYQYQSGTGAVDDLKIKDHIPGADERC